jgi:hypothetical protein
MIPTLENMCCKKVIDLNIYNLSNKLNHTCYSKVMEKIRKKHLEKWKYDIEIVNLELPIEEIDTHYDMFMGDIVIVIEIKNKNSDEIEVYYPYFDDPEYSDYLYIAEQRNIIENGIMET